MDRLLKHHGSRLSVVSMPPICPKPTKDSNVRYHLSDSDSIAPVFIHCSLIITADAMDDRFFALNSLLENLRFAQLSS